MLYIYNNGLNSSFEREDNQYYWSVVDTSWFLSAIQFGVENESGTLIIECDQIIGSPYYSSGCRGNIDAYLSSILQLLVGGTGGGGCIFSAAGYIIYGLKITFIPGEATTSTSTTTSTTTQQPIGSKVFIHVGDINIPDNSCGRYKLTLDGAKSSYFSIYGKRVYLTTYPENTGVYSVNVCAKDIANRYTPVCDTFDITIKKCVFTTEPPTTTAAPNFGYVHSENSVSPVSQYTYNKIYGIKKK